MTCRAREPFSLTDSQEEEQHTNVNDLFILYADLSEPFPLCCLSPLWHFVGLAPITSVS